MINKPGNKKPLFILFPIACLFGIAGIVMWLWNMLLPEIIGVKSINYWQAMGIFVLSKILFGGFHGKCGGRKRMGWGKENFCHTQNNTATNDSCEAKDKFKEEFKKRFKSRFCQ